MSIYQNKEYMDIFKGIHKHEILESNMKSIISISKELEHWKPLSNQELSQYEKDVINELMDKLLLSSNNIKDIMNIPFRRF